MNPLSSRTLFPDFNNLCFDPFLFRIIVKAEVHSSSSGAGSDGNLSSSDFSDKSADRMKERNNNRDHDYEDIYLARDENRFIYGGQSARQSRNGIDR